MIRIHVAFSWGFPESRTFFGGVPGMRIIVYWGGVL